MRRVAAEVMTLIYEKYCAHLLRGCSRDQCVMHGAVRVAINSLLCPVCTRHNATHDPNPHKMLFAADLARLATEVASTHNIPQAGNRIVTTIRRMDKDITAFTPCVANLSYPRKSRLRAWAVTDWAQLALQLAAISPKNKYRIYATSDRIQHHNETCGAILSQSTAVLRRLCTAAGVPFPVDQLSLHQMVQYSRHHALTAFEHELDKIRFKASNTY
jgi:hypothetical protein